MTRKKVVILGGGMIGSAVGVSSELLARGVLCRQRVTIEEAAAVA